VTPQAIRSPAAQWMLGAHVALILFATLAMVTILAGEFPTWMQGPYTARVYALGWQYTGQAYVVLGLLATVLHAAPRFGWARTIAFVGATGGIALASELAGTNIGLPFGAYEYTQMLGYRILGDVPYAIPLSWTYMLYCCVAMAGRFPSLASRPWRWAMVAGAMLTAWDVGLEVHMTSIAPPHWVWLHDAMPAWLPAWLTRGVFYGMPLINWVGWFVTATVIARVALAIVPPREWIASVSPTAFPFVLFAVNGLMPVATIARHGLWLGAVAGTVAMAVPVVLAWRAGRRGG
jgi:uncharacterized membrane protein